MCVDRDVNDDEVEHKIIKSMVLIMVCEINVTELSCRLSVEDSFCGYLGEIKLSLSLKNMQVSSVM